MILRCKIKMAKAGLHNKIPARIRFKAWWEGYAAADLFARPKTVDTLAPEPIDKPTILLPAEIPITPRTSVWADAQLQAVQLVWGNGRADPLPLYLVQQCKASNHNNIMLANAGFGGLQEFFLSEKQLTVDGYDSRSALVNAALDQKNLIGAKNTPPLIHLDMAQDKPFLRRYDLALIDNLYSNSVDLISLTNALAGTMATEGEIILQDWFRDDDSDLADVKRTVAKIGNPEIVQYCTLGEVTALFQQRNFSIIHTEDITEASVAKIADSWRLLHELMIDPKGIALAPGIMPALHREIEKWQVRLTLAREGMLRLKGITLKKDL
jgi:hypothetical protein